MAAPVDPDPSERVEDLLADYVERRESGEAITPESFAAEHADDPSVGALRDALLRLHRTEDDFPTPDGTLLQVGPYRVLDEIGRGGMGRVLRVVHEERPSEELALKVLHTAISAESRARQRFEREADVLRRLQHPGIVAVRDAGVAGDGSPYLVMDRIDGPSLAQVLADPAEFDRVLGVSATHSRSRRVAALGARIAHAVAHAHEHGVLHRDLKPSNVLLVGTGADLRPVLIDLGLAHDDAGVSLTATGDVLGTPHFMAPEQARGERVDERTDVYGIGAILYQLVTGAVPHPGTDRLAVLAAVGREPVTIPSETTRHEVALFDGILRRALAFRSHRRFASASALAEPLDAIARGDPTPSLGISLSQRLDEFYLRHRRSLTIGTVAALAATAIGLGWLALADDGRERIEALMREATLARSHGDTAAVRAAGEALASIDATPLAHWLRDWSATRGARAGDPPLVAALATGEAALARDDSTAALRAFRDAERAAPELLLPNLLIALAARAADRHDVAAAELAIVVHAFPDDPQLRRRLARELEAIDDDDGAAVHLATWSELEPDSPEPWHRLARMRFANRDYEAGLAAMEQALTRCGPEVPAPYQRTYASVLPRERVDEALAIWQRLAETAPHSARNRWNLAIGLDKAHRIDEAEREYVAILEQAPDHVEALACLAWLYAGSDTDCAECVAWFDAHPDYLRPDRARELTTRVVDVDRGRTRGGLPTAMQIAARLGFVDELIAQLEGLLYEGDEELDERATKRVTQAVRWLRRRTPR